MVTIVVPVYNTSKELVRRAVISALDQQHDCLEVVIVDDGSALDVADYLDQLGTLDSRVRILRQMNSGVSAARNKGVENAAGAFVAYLDADDFLHPQFLTEALALARRTGSDVVFGGIRILRSDGTADWRSGGAQATNAKQSSSDNVLTACKLALSYSPSEYCPTSPLAVTNVVSALYKVETARKYAFLPGLAQAEDRLHNVQVLLGSDVVSFCSNLWYSYDTTHDEGATRKVTDKTVNGLTKTVLEYAQHRDLLLQRESLTLEDRASIAQAAADGTFKYIKVLSGAMAVIGSRRCHQKTLIQLLSQSSVVAAIQSAETRKLQDKVFAWAARRRRVRTVLLLGKSWTFAGGLKMASDMRPERKPTNGANR